MGKNWIDSSPKKYSNKKKKQKQMETKLNIVSY